MSCKYEQMEFDFSEPAEPEEVATFRIEITIGFDGEGHELKTDFTGTRTAACNVLAGYAKVFRGYNDTWTHTSVGDHTVVDFGSHVYFGRLTRV